VPQMMGAVLWPGGPRQGVTAPSGPTSVVQVHVVSICAQPAYAVRLCQIREHANRGFVTLVQMSSMVNLLA
jgi:hypothetical protein